MSQTDISSFKELLVQSVAAANKKFVLLLQVLFFLLLFFVKDFVFAAISFFIGMSIKGAIGTGFEVLALAYVFFMFLKYNGALGLTLSLISVNEIKPYEIAKKSDQQGIYFFLNALRTGVILFMGQVVMVCPCFLLMSNFIFSPFLFVYEKLKGGEAKKRSRELTAGFGWVVLNRSAIILFVGYIFLALIVLSLLTKFILVSFGILFIVGLYIGLVQASFIRNIYLEAKNFQVGSVQQINTVSLKFKMLTIFTIALMLLFYIGIRIIPQSLSLK